MTGRIMDENLGRIVRVRKAESDANGREAFLFEWECSLDVWYENSEEHVWADFNPVAVLIEGKLTAMDDGRMGYLCDRRLLAYVADKAAKLEDIPMGEITLPSDEEADEIIARYGVPTRPLEDYQSRQQEWLDRWDAQGKLGVSTNNYILVKERAIADGFPDVYYNSLAEALRAEKRVEDKTAKPARHAKSKPDEATSEELESLFDDQALQSTDSGASVKKFDEQTAEEVLSRALDFLGGKIFDLGEPDAGVAPASQKKDVAEGVSELLKPLGHDESKFPKNVTQKTFAQKMPEKAFAALPSQSRPICDTAGDPPRAGKPRRSEEMAKKKKTAANGGPKKSHGGQWAKSGDDYAKKQAAKTEGGKRAAPLNAEDRHMSPKSKRITDYGQKPPEGYMRTGGRYFAKVCNARPIKSKTTPEQELLFYLERAKFLGLDGQSGYVRSAANQGMYDGETGEMNFRKIAGARRLMDKSKVYNAVDKPPAGVKAKAKSRYIMAIGQNGHKR